MPYQPTNEEIVQAQEWLDRLPASSHTAAWVIDFKHSIPGRHGGHRYFLADALAAYARHSLAQIDRLLAAERELTALREALQPLVKMDRYGHIITQAEARAANSLLRTASEEEQK